MTARVYSSKYTDKMEIGEFWIEETPTGAINGSNKTFTLSDSPNPTTSLELEINGQAVTGVGVYSLSGDTITMVNAWRTGTTIYARFRTEPS